MLSLCRHFIYFGLPKIIGDCVRETQIKNKDLYQEKLLETAFESLLLPLQSMPPSNSALPATVTTSAMGAETISLQAKTAAPGTVTNTTKLVSELHQVLALTLLILQHYVQLERILWFLMDTPARIEATPFLKS